MIKLYSLNVRGLRDHQKRREIFNFLKHKSHDIIYLQEAHSSREIENKWVKEWGGKISFSHFTSRARGTITTLVIPTCGLSWTHVMIKRTHVR